MLFRIRWALVALALFGCRPPQTQVPTQYQGTELVIIENHLNADLCEFTMTKKGDFPSKNWLGRKLAAGSTVQLRVKPGLYTLSVGCYGAFHGMDNVIVAGPGATALGIGKRPKMVRGQASLLIPVTMNANSAGEAQPAGGGEEQSCTGMCGGPQGQFGNCCPEEGWHCVIDPKERRDQGDSATGVCTLN